MGVYQSSYDNYCEHEPTKSIKEKYMEVLE